MSLAIKPMPVMSECGTILLSLSNYQTFAFTKQETHSSVATGDLGLRWRDKSVGFLTNEGMAGLGIINTYKGEKYAFSRANQLGYNVTIDDEGRNMLTGHEEDGGTVKLKMIEVYKIECKKPPE